jgi:hypothetical protein
MQPTRIVPMFAALVLLFLSSCLGPGQGIEDLSPEQLARRERIVFLASKSAAQRLIADGKASAADLAKAADIVEAAATADLPGALAAAGYSGPEWELFALLVQDRIEPYRLSPFVERFVIAAARGVREGTIGMTDEEKVELEAAPPPPKPSARREVPADEELELGALRLAAAGEQDARLRAPVASLRKLSRSELVLGAA